MADYSPIFLDNHPLSDWSSKNYVAPAYYDERFNQRIRDIRPASEFRKVSPVRQAANIAVPYEKYVAEPYEDGDHYSIGYGTTAKDGDKSITEPEARRRMFEDLEERHKALLKYPAYRSANPNAQGGLLDTFYTAGIGLDKHSPMVSRMMQNPTYIPYIIQEIPTYRKAVVNGKRDIVEGLERRRGDDIRLATDPNDKEYFPTFIR
jgi:GH24 family phage-related lysozyme (muramidase)